MEESPVNSSHRITENDHGRRIDRVLRKMFPTLSLSALYKMLRKRQVKLCGKKVSPSALVKTGDEITVYMKSAPAVKPDTNETDKASAISMVRGLVVYEDKDMLALNKPFGMLVHGEGSLEALVRAYLADSIPDSLSFTPGPVHRLDRNTTGLILFAKSLACARYLSTALRESTCAKFYMALLSGHMRHEEHWRDILLRDRALMKTTRSDSGEGKEALTTVIPVSSDDEDTLALCIIGTGRTHQIRAQASFHRHPLAGDVKYGGRRTRNGYILHAAAMKIPDGPGFPGRLILAGLPPKADAAIEKRFGRKAVDDAYSLAKKMSGGRG
jgi:23S rRNA pseudouridine955/2504/2580 synthase